MATQEKQIHFRVKEDLFIRLQRVAAQNELRVSQLLRHVLEKSLDLIELNEAGSVLPPSTECCTQESRGKTYTFRNVAYQIGGEPWQADASER